VTNQSIQLEETKGRHIYSDNRGQSFPGVTTVLGLVGGQGLITWASNVNTDYVYEKLGWDPDTKKFSTPTYEIPQVLPHILELARKRHTNLRDAAGEKGKAIHFAFEQRLKGLQIPSSLLRDEFVYKVLDNFDAWLKKTDFKLLHSEVKLINPDGSYGGTADAIATMKDRGTVLIDFKTGKTLAKTVFYQLAAYCMAYGKSTSVYDDEGNIIEDCFPDSCMALHVLKSGAIKEKCIMTRPEYEERYKYFQHLVAFYKDYQNKSWG
jgi:hypothetical protein